MAAKFQFCVECGTPNEFSSRYCVKCSELLVLTIAKIEKAPRVPWSRSKKTVVWSGVFALTSGFLFAIWPKPVAVVVDVQVQTPYGGVLNEDCTLTEAGRKLGATEVELVEFGAQPGGGAKAQLTYELGDAGCTAKATPAVFGGKTYDAYIAGALAGQIKAEDIDAGMGQLEIELAVKNDLAGVIVLSDHYNNCKASDKGSSCSIPVSSASVWMQLQKDPAECYGVNSFSDFKKVGTKITITGLSTKQSVSAKLAAGVPSVTDYSTGKIVCEFKFEAPGLVYDSKGYRVKVGNHAAEPIDTKELDVNGWSNYTYEFKG